VSGNGLTKPFEKRLRRCEYRPGKLDVKPFVKELKEAGFNLLVSSATVGTGFAFFDSKLRPHVKDMDPGYITELINECHANDIMVITWFCFGIEDVYDMDAYQPLKMFPDGRMEFINPPEGEPDAIGMCMFTSDFIERRAEFLQEVMALGFDGVWFDGTSGAGMPNRDRLGCVCPSCRKAFMDDAGLDVPSKIDWADPIFRRWVVWRYEQLRKTFELLNRKVLEVNPDAHVTFSESNRPWGPGQWFLDWKFAQNIDRHNGYVLSAHTGLGPTNSNQHLPFHAQMVRAAAPVADIWSPVYSAREAPNSRSLPAQALNMRMHALGAIAHGVIPWFGVFPFHFDTFKPINEAVARREEFFGGEPVRHAGLVVSTRTRDFWGTANDRVGQYSETLYGIHSILAQHHIEMGVLFDSDLDLGDRLEQFKVIILPRTTCITDKGAENLRRWVAEGGLLIAAGEATTMDEWGGARDDFALADVFGVSLVSIGADEDPNELVLEPLDDGLTETRKAFSFDAPFTRIRINSESVEVLARVAAKLKRQVGDDTDVSTLDSGGSEPAITLHPFGKGHAVYLTPELGVGYTRWPHKNTRELLAGLVRRRPLPYEVDAPTVVISNAFIQDDPKRLMVHLLNLPPASNRVVRPGWPGDELCGPGARSVLDEILPIYDITVSVRDYNVKSARLPLSEQELEIVREGDIARVVVPRLDDHDIVELVLET